MAYHSPSPYFLPHCVTSLSPESLRKFGNHICNTLGDIGGKGQGAVSVPHTGRGLNLTLTERVDATPPLSFCHARWTIIRIVLKFSVAFWYPLRNFWLKQFDGVMSGHGPITSQREQGQTIFARNGGLCTLEGDIDHNELMSFNLLDKVRGQVKVKVRSVT